MIENVQEYIRKRVHELYYGIDMNCARTTLTVLSELLDVKTEEQTMDAALGLHGAGGFRAQCGLVEGALMFIGIWGRLHGKEEKDIVKACYEYASQFTVKFGALTCRELRPGGFQETDPPHLCEILSSNSIIFAYRYVTEWVTHEDGEPDKGESKIRNLIMRTHASYRTGWLKMHRIPEKSGLHIRDYYGISYLYEYVPYKKLGQADRKTKALIRDFYEFTRGDRKSTYRISQLYYQYLKQFLWMKKITGNYVLSVIPSSDPAKQNPLNIVAGAIIKKNNYVHAYTIDGRNLLVRSKKLSPVNKGNFHTILEQMDSMFVAKKPSCDTVILLDDIVNTGSTADACIELLKKESVKNVYVLCLFSCRR